MSLKDKLIVNLALLNPCLYTNGWFYRKIVKLCKLDCECCSYMRAMVWGWLIINTLLVILGAVWKVVS